MQVQLPAYVDYVKLGSFKELAPLDPDWYYIRAGGWRAAARLACLVWLPARQAAHSWECSNAHSWERSKAANAAVPGSWGAHEHRGIPGAVCQLATDDLLLLLLPAAA